MDMKVRKKPVLRKNGAMGFALKQWNKVAPEYALSVTQRKDQQRLDAVKKVVRAMERAGMDWRDKEVWRGVFRSVGQHKSAIELERNAELEQRRMARIERLREENPEDPRVANLERAKGCSDFRVTFDWAICLRNTSQIVGLDP